MKVGLPPVEELMSELPVATIRETCAQVPQEVSPSAALNTHQCACH